VFYKVDAFRYAEGERSILWNDPQLGINWPVTPAQARLSPKDAEATVLLHAQVYETGMPGAWQ
jgi:dTDP-4-dehydrorhamnose 3,5-epimerase